MPPEPLAHRISRELAARIVSGRIAPGERLRQDHIAAEFGASHVPVREAFRHLESRGLAVSEPRRGFRVAGFSSAEVREVAEMRAALEVLALRHAAPHLTLAPGIMLTTTLLSLNIFGEGVRDALDPRAKVRLVEN